MEVFDNQDNFAPYLTFILVFKYTHPDSLVLSSQNAQCFYISAPLIHPF